LLLGAFASIEVEDAADASPRSFKIEFFTIQKFRYRLSSFLSRSVESSPQDGTGIIVHTRMADHRCADTDLLDCFCSASFQMQNNQCSPRNMVASLSEGTHPILIVFPTLMCSLSRLRLGSSNQHPLPRFGCWLSRNSYSGNLFG
jgi:hypothetical protein